MDDRQRRAPAAHGTAAADAFYNRSSATPSNAIQVPQLALPKGGGALKSIDEKFSVNAVNGTATVGLPLPLAPAPAQPPLSLSYDSGRGNSPFGLGWSLELPSIQRRTDKQLPRYRDSDESDVFLLSNAEDLVPARHDDGTLVESTGGGFTVRRYRPRIESAFARIERVWPDGEDTFHWKVTTRDNTVTFYGLTAAARIFDPAHPRKVFRWLPELAFDDKGNVIAYEYKSEDGAPGPSATHDRNRYDDQGQPRFTQRLLKRARYGNRQPWYPAYVSNSADVQSLYQPTLPALDFSFELAFDYGEHGALPSSGDTQATVSYDEQQPWAARADAHSDYRAGFELRTMRLCRRVLQFHHFDELGALPCLVRSLDLEYAASMPDTAQLAEVTYLVAATMRGYSRRAGELYDFTAMPPASFTYQALDWQSAVEELTTEGAPEGLSANYQWVDLYDEGISGILSEQADALFYKRNLGGGQLAAPCAMAVKPSLTGLAGGTLSLQDLDGDGGRQLVFHSGRTQGFFDLDEARPQPFIPFAAQTTVDVGAANVLKLDLDGDGRADLLIAEDWVLRWIPSLGRGGWGTDELAPKAADEEAGPTLLWTDPVQRIFLADLSGDGLTDIVRIRSGEVCYWPNLGYGQFGAKVTMDGAPTFAPPDLFDPKYILLADVSGTGAADLLYLGGKQASVWLNLSGNAWGAPYQLALPDTALPNRLAVVDLLGSGTSCLVWSSPLPENDVAPLRYVDLLGGKKPHLLVSLDNGAGKQTTLGYQSSTSFYLSDALAGRPWKTRLPFPVHCLARVETREQVTNTLLVQEYSYHHGYYDHAEREFRGFGRVDRRDGESFSRWIRQDASNVLDEQFHEPVVLTRSWFHTGAPPDGADPLGLFAADYWYADPDWLALSGSPPPSEPSLPPSALPLALSPVELREAHRACKGMMLREEVFALDAPDQGATHAQLLTALTPFSVALHNCIVRLLQPTGDNRYAVFAVHESEALTLSYERAPADPLITHTLHLDIDDYGNVLESVSIGYGRQLSAAPAGTPAEVWQEQQQTRAVLTERAVTDDDFKATPAVYRLPAEHELRTYELTGVAPAAQLFELEPLLTAVKGAAELGFEKAPPADGLAHKRLLSHKRVLFVADDLASPRALGKLSPLGLVHEDYQLALTLPLLRQMFPVSKIADADVESLLGSDGKYVHFDDLHGTSDGDWWIASGTIDRLDAQTAPLRFYQPAAYVDPRGATTSVYYLGEDATRVNVGAHWQVPAQLVDAKGNETLVETFDFRALQPLRLIDPNANATEVVLDDLGRVIALALSGKAGEGDALDLLKAQLADRAQVAQTEAQLLANADDASATALLQDATARFVYDTTQVPLRVAAIRRERHVQELAQSGDPLELQLSFEYSGGAGNVVMTKARVAPGDAWTLDGQNQKLLVTGANPRWVGNGRVVSDNKGNPVKQFEPYFSVTHAYEDDKALTDVGVSPLWTYDSLGRPIRTDHPDGSYELTRFDSWSQQLFDRNDTVKSSQWYASRISLPSTDPRQQAAAATELHDDTPTTIFLDARARSFSSVAHNRAKKGDLSIEETFPVTRAQLDIVGNVRAVVDARGNTVAQSDYDMVGRALHSASTDAGERWTLMDVVGSAIYHWDSRDQRLRTVFDELRRPTGVWLSVGGAAETSFGNTEWGELAPNAQAANLRGHAWKVYDQSGLVETVAHDFKGNLIENQRRFTTTYDQTIAWPEVNPDGLLDPETFRTRSEYDALNRPLRTFSPDTASLPASEILPAYDEGGRLTQLGVKLRGAASATAFVSRIDYDEKGRRRSIQYANGSTTLYDYEPDTFRLSRLTTTRDPDPPLQDLSFVYDPMGNPTSVGDDAQQSHYFNGAVASPSASYEYDALYQLTRALGREQIGQQQPPDPWDAARTGQILPGDAQAMQEYDQRYEHDLAGNLVTMIHNAGSGGQFLNRWTRQYSYDTASNRLLSTQIGSSSESYGYNPHGSLASMPHLQAMDWDVSERLMHIRQGTTEAHYNYDGSGARTRKVVDKQGGLREVRLYLGGFELFRRYQNGVLVLERETQHVMDDKSRIALVDTDTEGGDGTQLIRYQLANHLGSACVETDVNAAVITYEEFHPFGSSAWQAGRSAAEVALKRYRYTGVERDEESGLGYHGARYYASWLGRWTAADPAGLADGLNRYTYSRNSPAKRVDPGGTDSEEALDPKKKGSDKVKVASKEEAAEARQIYTEITTKYGLKFDSQAVADKYNQLFKQKADEKRQQGGMVLERSTNVKAWTLDELRELKQSLAYFDPIEKPLNKGAVLQGMTLARLDVALSREGLGSAPTVSGEVKEPWNTISFFDAGGPKKLGTMVHELAHVFFKQFEDDFEAKLPFWGYFPGDKNPATPRSSLQQLEDTEKARLKVNEIINTSRVLARLGANKIDAPAPKPLERPPSPYGFTSPLEDVAESVMSYLLYQQSFRTYYPERTALIESKWKALTGQADALRGPRP